MSISVVVNTVSLGGLDMLFNSLAEQVDSPPFEVVLVDEWYDHRGQLVFERVGDEFFTARGFKVKHVPVVKKQPFRDDCNGWNTGLRAAEGELICFLTDYNWVYPAYLEDHWRIYKACPGYSMIGYCDRYPWPRTATTIYGDGDLWWTAFAQEMTPERAAYYFSHVDPVYHERRGNYRGPAVAGTQYNELPGNLYYAGLNESIPLAVLKELNGWDERYDGGYASCDVDIGVRANMLGWKFLLNPTVTCRIGQASTPRPVKTVVKPQLRTPEENYAMFQHRVAAISAQAEMVRVPVGWGCWE